jgi:hypothetical protein
MFGQTANCDDRSHKRRQADPWRGVQYIPEQDQQWQMEEVRRERE